MKNRTLRMVFALALLVLGTGCSDTYSTLFIRQVQAPDPEDDCSVTNDPTGFIFLEGFMDKRIEASYQATLLVGNQMTPRGNNSLLRPESGRIQLYEMEIEVFDFTGASLAFFAAPVSGFVDIANSTLPGYGLVSTDLLPQAVAAAIDTSAGPQTVVTRMRVFGNTTGGSEVDSAPWDFPIVVAGTPGARPATIPLKPEDCQVAAPPACRPLQANGAALDCRIMNDPYVLQPGFDPVDCNCPQP